MTTASCSTHSENLRSSGLSTSAVSMLGKLTNVETRDAFICVAGYDFRRAQDCSGLSSSLSQVASLSRGRITGIRSWIGASSLSGAVVMIVHDVMAVFVLGSVQVSQRPANANTSPDVSVIQWGTFRVSSRCHS